MYSDCFLSACQLSSILKEIECLYIYIYIYIYVCVCVCLHIFKCFLILCTHAYACAYGCAPVLKSRVHLRLVFELDSGCALV